MRTILIASLLLAWSAAAHAVADYGFLGPVPARQFQPLRLIFLQLPFERAATMKGGRLALHVNSAESNVIATTRGTVESLLKFETNRTVIAARYAPRDGWEVGLDLPFVSRFGGFLDPFVDAVEGAFGTGNPERDWYPNNSFGDFRVFRGQKRWFHGREVTLEPGDLWLSVKREIRLGQELPLLAVRAAVKAPTGRADGVLGSGKPDFGLGLAAEHRVLRRLMLYMNVNLVYPVGPITPARLTLNPMVSESIAAEFALTRCLSAVLHQATYTSPMHGTGTALLDGTAVELGFGANYAWSPSLGFQFLAIDNVNGVEKSADFTLLLAVTLKVGAGVPVPDR